MYSVNRIAAVIKPKQPFLSWLMAMPDWDSDLALEDLRREECTVILTPDFDSLDEARDYVEDMYETLFELELDSWYRDEAAWPRGRTLQMFREWFDVELHSTVIDVAEEDIQEEDY
jgi:hypothetical protein